jgi:tRNA pseudouridine55 synthase
VSTDLILPVDKPVGPTSHDVVAQARRALEVKRIGHTGTLDPFASGLLMLCVGRATRLAEYLTGLDKGYEAVARLGVTTDTEDHQGAVVEERGGWESLTEDYIRAAMADFRGSIDQVPPQFSAKRVDGVRMHERARRGEHVELEARTITVHELELIDFDAPFLRFRTLCSSGTYVRSLARDLGEALEVGAHLTELRRTSIGRFSLEGAISTEDLGDGPAVASAGITPLQAMAHLPAIAIDEADVTRLRHGQPVELDDPTVNGLVAAAFGDTLVAIGEVREGKLRPKKVFVS